MNKIVLLGSTGSIGTQCLDILRFSYDYQLVGVSLNSRYEVLEDYLLYFDSLKYVAIVDENKAKEFKSKHPDYIVFSGLSSSCELLKVEKEATVFNSILGNEGLKPSLLAIKQNQDLLLSNKESLVIGSSLIKKLMKTSTSHIYPVDSEHVALAKLLAYLAKEKKTSTIEKLIVTASGGALRNKTKEEIKNATVHDVLNHPTWKMGAKITVDCSTLVNKAFEVIEASEMFSYPLDKVGAIICRESLVHAEIKYDNGKVVYEYSPVSMKVAIAYALSKGKLEVHKNNQSDLLNISKLHFNEIDLSFYPAFSIALKTFSTYGNAGMIYFNAVDTEIINKFLSEKVKYLDIITALNTCYEKMPKLEELTEENIDEVILNAENYAKELVSKMIRG